MPPGSSGLVVGLAAGDKITVQDDVLGVITQSGNDAAMVLAEAVSGSEAAFVAAMNERAQTLRLEQSYFVNPTGLPNSSANHKRTRHGIAGSGALA